jgi:hypothetical protein
MSQSQTKGRSKPPLHIQRAVIARDGDRCRNCGVATEFYHWDHLLPVDLGGPTTAENIQILSPKCNISKGNKIQCGNCRHWMTPDKSRCTQCETPLFKTKYSKTFKGRLERLFQKVGIATVIGAAVIALLIFLGGSGLVAFYFLSSNADSDQAATVNTIVNKSFTAAFVPPVSFKVTVPNDAKNARIVGGFKATAGTTVSFYIVSERQFAQWAASTAKPALLRREQTDSARIRQPLQPGIYYLLFSSPDIYSTVNVAAEFYSKYD